MLKVFFCPETLGFYPGAPYGDAVGKACIELSESEYQALAGHALALDSQGRPMQAADQPLSHEQLESGERAWRDSELVKVLWLREPHRDQLEMAVATTISSEAFTELLIFMQSLRDWPQSLHFPDSAYRPAVPVWLTDKINPS